MPEPITEVTHTPAGPTIVPTEYAEINTTEGKLHSQENVTRNIVFFVTSVQVRKYGMEVFFCSSNDASSVKSQHSVKYIVSPTFRIIKHKSIQFHIHNQYNFSLTDMHMRLNAVPIRGTTDMNASSATPVVSAMSDGPHVNIIPKLNKIKKYVRRVNAQNLKKNL